MPRMTAVLQNRTGALDDAFSDRLDKFLEGWETAAQKAAGAATRASRRNVKRVRELAPVRRGRYHGLANAIQWQADPVTGDVELDIPELNRRFPPWVVQEIGTGERARQLVGGAATRGRPSNASYIRVKSQVGRRLSPAFVFASRGGQYSAPGAATGQQVYLRSQVQGAPVRFSGGRSVPGIRISKEIEGQHFIQKGAREGFREYRSSVLAAARSSLRKRR